MGFQPAPIGHVHRARCNIIDRGVGVRGGKRTQFLRKICRANPLFRGASERWCSGRPRRRPAACRLARCFLTRIQGCGTCGVRRLPLTGCGWSGIGRDPPKTLVKRIQAPVQEQTVAKKNGGPRQCGRIDVLGRKVGDRHFEARQARARSARHLRPVGSLEIKARRGGCIW
jgi:hypothetical protein